MCVLTQPDLPTAVSGPGKGMWTEMQDQNKTNGSEGTCLSIQGSAQPHRAQAGLLSRWGKSCIPLKWASLGWKPCVSSLDDPRPHLYLCRGEPWSWALCLPARFLGSRVGVARQAHHSALGCFAFGVKRDPQMSRHCHSSNLSPQEFQRWVIGGHSWSAVLSHVSVGNILIFQQILRSIVKWSLMLQNTVWHCNIGWKSYICEFKSQFLACCADSYDVHIILVSIAEKSAGISARLQKIKFLWGGDERSCHQKSVFSFHLC